MADLLKFNRAGIHYYTVPAGVRSLKLHLWGAGGSSGSGGPDTLVQVGVETFQSGTISRQVQTGTEEYVARIDRSVVQVGTQSVIVGTTTTQVQTGFETFIAGSRLVQVQTGVESFVSGTTTRQVKIGTEQVKIGTRLEERITGYQTVVVGTQTVQGVVGTEQYIVRYDTQLKTPARTEVLTPAGNAQFTSVGPFQWVCPLGVKTIRFTVVGGGAGGSRGSEADPDISGGGGGGSGGIVNNATASVRPNESYSGTVGAGGAGANASDGDNNAGWPGEPGFDSNFMGRTATGGQPSNGSGGHFNAGGAGGTPGGQAGAPGARLRAGSGNGWSQSGGNGGTVNPSPPFGAGGSGASGYAGAPKTAGSPGQAPGGGGGGGNGGSNDRGQGSGGAGASGAVYIEWDQVTQTIPAVYEEVPVYGTRNVFGPVTVNLTEQRPVYSTVQVDVFETRDVFRTETVDVISTRPVFSETIENVIATRPTFEARTENVVVQQPIYEARETPVIETRPVYETIIEPILGERPVFQPRSGGPGGPGAGGAYAYKEITVTTGDLVTFIIGASGFVSSGGNSIDLDSGTNFSGGDSSLGGGGGGGATVVLVNGQIVAVAGGGGGGGAGGPTGSAGTTGMPGGIVNSSSVNLYSGQSALSRGGGGGGGFYGGAAGSAGSNTHGTGGQGGGSAGDIVLPGEQGKVGGISTQYYDPIQRRGWAEQDGALVAEIELTLGIKVKQNNTWKRSFNSYVKVSNDWKKINAGWVKVSGQWLPLGFRDEFTPIQKTYSITSNVASINEGQAVLFTLSTTGVDNGTVIPYTISGISAVDISAGGLTGSFIIGSVNTIELATVPDYLTTGTRKITVRLNNSTITGNCTLNDTSLTPVYSISANRASMNEGEAVRFTISSGDPKPGDRIPYLVSGISLNQLSAGLTSGSFVWGSQDFIELATAVDYVSDGNQVIVVSIPGATAQCTVIDSSTTPFYTVSPNVASVNEGNAVRFTISSVNPKPGDVINYSVAGITQQDLSSGSLTGTFTWGTEQTRDFSISADKVTDGNKVMVMNIVGPSNGSSASVNVLDTSQTPTYTVASNVGVIDEGQAVRFTISSLNPENGEVIPYTITGITASELVSGSLRGTFVWGTTQSLDFVTVPSDFISDGQKTMKMTVQNSIATVIIQDSSTTPAYSLAANVSSINEGQAVRFTLNSSNPKVGEIIPYTIVGITAADLSSGSLTGNFIWGTTQFFDFATALDYYSDGNKQMIMTTVYDAESVTVLDTSTSTSYTVSANAASITEGQAVRFTITSTNSRPGESIPYNIQGITVSDLSQGSLNGNFVWGSTQFYDFVLAADFIADGDKIMRMNIPGSTAAVTVIDSSQPPVYTLSVVPSGSVNEGQSVTFSVSSPNGRPGDVIPYTITGISAADLSSGSLTGTFTWPGAISLTFTVAADETTEPTPETMTMAIAGSSASVTINDTSVTIPPTYTVNASPTAVNEGSSVTFTVNTTRVPNGTTLYYRIVGTGVTNNDFSGGLTGSMIISGGSSTFSKIVTADLSSSVAGTEENVELFVLQLLSSPDTVTPEHQAADSRLVLANSPTISINDTSKYIPPEPDPIVNSIRWNPSGAESSGPTSSTLSWATTNAFSVNILVSGASPSSLTGQPVNGSAVFNLPGPGTYNASVTAIRTLKSQTSSQTISISAPPPQITGSITDIGAVANSRTRLFFSVNGPDNGRYNYQITPNQVLSLQSGTFFGTLEITTGPGNTSSIEFARPHPAITFDYRIQRDGYRTYSQILTVPARGGAGTQSFTTPGQHSFKVPDYVTQLTVNCYGGGGGGGGADARAGSAGRPGDLSTATVSVTSGETLTIFVGGGGGGGISDTTKGSPGVAGGGGGYGYGNGGGGGASGPTGISGSGGGGGGGSAVLRAGIALIVAGGGGGGGGGGKDAAGRGVDATGTPSSGTNGGTAANRTGDGGGSGGGGGGLVGGAAGKVSTSDTGGYSGGPGGSLGTITLGGGAAGGSGASRPNNGGAGSNGSVTISWG